MDSLLPLVTVLMPVYNGERYLSSAIESILNQTFQDFELLIVDDCSNDNSIKIIESFSNKKINLIRNNKNQGQSATMNRGLKLSKGKYIARLDQDDLSDYQRLEKQVEFFLNNKCNILGTWAYSINNDSKITGYIQHPTTNNSIQNALGVDCALSHSSVMMKKNDILLIGGYSEKFKIVMDWDLWIRAVKSGLKIENIPEYLCSSRLHSLQTISNNVGAKNLIKEKVVILNKSKSIIKDKSNYNAYLGWKYYYDTLYYLKNINKDYNFKSFFFGKKRFKGLIELLKLIFFHKIIKKPENLYTIAVRYKKV